MRLQLIRHASLWLQYGPISFLIDPMLSEKEENPPIANSPNSKRNPLVPLPSSVDAWIQPDVVIVTHLHRDHWDEAAIAALPKSIPILCQPKDGETISSQGFSSVTEVEESLKYDEVTLIRTTGHHGSGEIGEKMGAVSGFVLKAAGEPTVYITGDTIWCDDVKRALDTHQPDITIVNAGGARFTTGTPITMDDSDVVQLGQYAPYTKIVAVHMDAINHCLVTREDLQERLALEQMTEQVIIPMDGEFI